MDECLSNENAVHQANGEITIDTVHGSSTSINDYRNSQNGSSHSSSASTVSSDVGCYPASLDTDNDNNGFLSNDSATKTEYSIPILGYEISEEKARFTVFKLQVNDKSNGKVWHVYRRYTDFIRLHRKLKQKCPQHRLVLPPKRWFGDNFDSCFLEERLQGLQSYVNSVLANNTLCQSHPVKEFFCFDDPPPYNENIESRCISLEDEICTLKKMLEDKDEIIKFLQAELNLCKAQLTTVLKFIRLESSFSSLASNAKLSSSLNDFQDISSALSRVIEKSSSEMHPHQVNLSLSTPDLRKTVNNSSNAVIRKQFEANI